MIIFFFDGCFVLKYYVYIAMYTVKCYVFALNILLKHFLIQREKDKWKAIIDLKKQKQKQAEINYQFY